MPDPTPYLLYLGPLRPSESNGSERIARLIADHATVNLDGTFRMASMSDADELANHDGAAVIGPGGHPVLYVVDVPYHRALRLDEKGEPTDRKAAFKSLVGSIKSVALAVHRLRRAWKRSEAKSLRAKWQLAIGLMMVIGLAAFAILGILALVTAIWPDVLPEWMGTKKAGPRVTVGVLGVSVTLGTIYAFTRRRVSAFGRVAQRVLNYAEDPQARKEAARVLERAIDRLAQLSTDGQPRPKFHVLGYSFGSLLAVDAICPPSGSERGRRLDLISTLATIGCPADFVRLYYPEYFDHRSGFPEGVPWHNLFIASDVLGSNFLDSKNSDSATTVVEGTTVPGNLPQPTKNLKLGEGELSWIDLLKYEGFAMHARYWTDDNKTSTVDVLMPMWPPMSKSPTSEGAAND